MPSEKVTFSFNNTSNKFYTNQTKHVPDPGDTSPRQKQANESTNGPIAEEC